MLDIFGIHYFTDHILIFPDYKTPDKHRHFAKHLILGLDRNIECILKNKRIICRGICIQSNVIHTVSTQKTKTLVLLIDETSELARVFDSMYFQGNMYKIIIGAKKDHFIAKELYKDEIDALINVRSLTYRLFTEKECGEGHCNVGNPKLCFDTMMNWIEQIKNRDINV